ncbi:hypothetical protein F4801DRAFT_578652 [Xylaria longipes]|nr:hypothetical protein F4801DRAFT_578652 [Xylaria longipes]
MSSSPMVSMAEKAINLVIMECGVYSTALFLQCRIAKIAEDITPDEEAFDEKVNPEWFIYQVVYELARGLEISGLEYNPGCPAKTSDNNQHWVNWPAMKAIASAEEDCITAKTIFTAVITPQMNHPTKYDTLIAIGREDSPFTFPLYTIKVLEFDGVLGPFETEVVWVLRHIREIRNLKYRAMKNSRPAESRHECDSLCEEWVCSQHTGRTNSPRDFAAEVAALEERILENNSQFDRTKYGLRDRNHKRQLLNGPGPSTHTSPSGGPSTHMSPSGDTPLGDAEHIANPVEDAEHPTTPLGDAEHPTTPLGDVEHIANPVEDAEHPITPLEDGELHWTPLEDDELHWTPLEGDESHWTPPYGREHRFNRTLITDSSSEYKLRRSRKASAKEKRDEFKAYNEIRSAMESVEEMIDMALAKDEEQDARATLRCLRVVVKRAMAKTEKR